MKRFKMLTTLAFGAYALVAVYSQAGAQDKEPVTDKELDLRSAQRAAESSLRAISRDSIVDEAASLDPEAIAEDILQVDDQGLLSEAEMIIESIAVEEVAEPVETSPLPDDTEALPTEQGDAEGSSPPISRDPITDETAAIKPEAIVEDVAPADDHDMRPETELVSEESTVEEAAETDIADTTPIPEDIEDDSSAASTPSLIVQIASMLGGLAILAALLLLSKKLMGSKKTPALAASSVKKPSLVPINTVPPTPKRKNKQKKPPASGMVFPGSAMTAVSSASGLTGPLVILNEALRATGRIGFAQHGVPTNDDVAFGTGFLISDRHVLTNRHVFEMYRKPLVQEKAGIEFFAEKGSDASDFIAFSGREPRLANGLDIAIFELETPVSHRTGLTLNPVPSAELDGREIAVIGYPCPIDITDEIKAVVEEDPVFAVKRLSEGKIFKHSTDTDAIYGVETPVSKIINPSGKLNAICHDASTLGGSSGSPVLDKATGQLVGVHFGYDVAHDWAEAANFAIPIEEIIRVLKDLGIM